jgi:hypothetical protein
VEVRVYPTAFGWFGWCNDEILGQPEISADRRTWTYNHVGVEQIPTVVGRRHRKGSATEMVAVFYEGAKGHAVPNIEVTSPNVGAWKRMDVEVEWGFQPASLQTSRGMGWRRVSIGRDPNLSSKDFHSGDCVRRGFPDRRY